MEDTWIWLYPVLRPNLDLDDNLLQENNDHFLGRKKKQKAERCLKIKWIVAGQKHILKEVFFFF